MICNVSFSMSDKGFSVCYTVKEMPANAGCYTEPCHTYKTENFSEGDLKSALSRLEELIKESRGEKKDSDD